MLSTHNDISIVSVATCEWSQRGKVAETQGPKEGSGEARREAEKEVEKEVGKETRNGTGR